MDATLVMFEGGSRVQDTLHDIAITMGSREAAICREMTKLHEDVTRATVSELAAQADALETRGEFVIVIAPPPAGSGALSDDALDDVLRAALKDSSVKDAVAQAMEISGRPRREIYARALELAIGIRPFDGMGTLIGAGKPFWNVAVVPSGNNAGP